ncbi:MAG: ATP-binding cassette domain-containing protein [Kiritimatiellae bacterium]|nr:ATP-binding cassette domain-containing protein [Kiritimatiellia bacterium]
MTEPLLVANHLSKTFDGGGLFRKRPGVRAVQDVSVKIYAGEAFGLVGESGCGKSTLARLLLRLLEPSAGTVHFNGVEITALRGDGLRSHRRMMQMVFQDPYASLNPRMSIHGILSEPLRVHAIPRAEWPARMMQMLDQVGLPQSTLGRYPHELSGGQRQRVGIARALIVEPALIIADEPVAALDVSVQAQVLNLLLDLRKRLKLTLVFIAHDLPVVQYISDRVGVMLLGHLVEVADREALYREPLHPYTRMLLAAAPTLHAPVPGQPRRSVVPQGELPSPASTPSRCPFQSRCPLVQPACRRTMPDLIDVADGRTVACHAVKPGA